MNKNRIFATVLTAVLTLTSMFNCTAVFAAEAELKTLTVDEAVGQALSNSSDYKKTFETTELNRMNIESLQKRFSESTNVDTRINLATQILEAEAKSALTSGTVEQLTETLKLSITKFFSSIISAEKSLVLYDIDLDNSKRQLVISKTKNGLGLMSDVDYAKEKQSLTQKENNRASKELAIDNAYIALNKLMGASPGTRYKVELNFTYKPLGDVSLDSTAYQAMYASTNIKTLQANLDTAQRKYNINTSKNADEILTLEINLQQATRALSDAQTSISDKVLSLYNTIIDQETQYKSAVLQLETLKNQLEVKKTQLDLGKLTQLDYDTALYQIKQQEETIRSLVYSHEINVFQFNNPFSL